MDSINQNQPEENHRDLSGKDAVQQIKDAVQQIKDTVKSSDTCFFCTTTYGGPSAGARPMNVRTVDDAGSLWFLSASDSHKNAEIAVDPVVKLYLQGATHSEFLHLTGHATISQDKARIKELWNPILKTWFTEGLDDPRITVIEVVPTDAYYWDNKHGKAVAGVKMVVGAIIGKTLDDSVEGKLKV